MFRDTNNFYGCILSPQFLRANFNNYLLVKLVFSRSVICHNIIICWWNWIAPPRMLPVVDTTRACALEWMRKAVVCNSDFVYSTTGIPASSPMARIWNMTKIYAKKAKQKKATTVKTGKWNLILRGYDRQVSALHDELTIITKISQRKKNFKDSVLTILEIIQTVDPCYT